ncbi:TAXI family TRAP transporter solute-binding subunit [Bradyrhizobium sp. LHD-71]|uniref:TAXI family TRAP transporter solute-binding subunit n=1 Tax=Bradyrhizobium sp. LHD-71 TaxID=3072141 RepID=UPI00280F4913|nr:TAXI family TRAP transporter solute-binding subunit [Bradyrhizobium sp. LHD-71]MDQ8728938.1 TAXI family TRAP transporter solute-binding subunit [Bradyrhizobium sp. LHD-71]
MISSIIKFAAIALAGTAIASAANAQVKLPPTVTMTAYDTGTSGFNIAVAVGKMMKDKYGTDTRVLPAGNDVARLQPLRIGRAAISAMGAGVYFAQEGVFEFATKEWGPQAVQITLSSIDCNGLSLAVAGDAGAKTIADLKGKRVGFVVGSPALNQNALAILAFANLTAKDVKIVEFASNNAMWKGAVNNDVDALFGSTIAGPAKELETSPRGIVWPPLSHSDKAGWERVRKVGPYFTEHDATCGAGGISKAKPIQMGAYPYPIFSVYANQPEEEVYVLTKALIDGYDAYKDNAPGASGLGVKVQTKNWAVPVHKGAVKALKEAGAWSDDQEKHNNALIKRQEALLAAWADFNKNSPSSDPAKFTEEWMKARKTALAKARMSDTFE